jgi:hypothetical protein
LFPSHFAKEEEMKKLLVMVAVLSLFAASYASANQMNTGCGVGTLIFQDTKDQSTLVQAVAISTNGTFINSFGVTTGTSDCKQPSKVVKNERLNEFVHANLDDLARDISAGRGETLSTVAELMGVPSADRAAFNANLQAHFQEIFPTPGVEYAHVVDTIVSVSNQG